MKPNKRQLAEFNALWYTDGQHYLRNYATEKEARTALLDWHTYLWEGAGCPKKFYPAPTDAVFESGWNPDNEPERYDQEICPNRDWNLPQSKAKDW